MVKSGREDDFVVSGGVGEIGRVVPTVGGVGVRILVAVDGDRLRRHAVLNAEFEQAVHG